MPAVKQHTTLGAAILLLCLAYLSACSGRPVYQAATRPSSSQDDPHNQNAGTHSPTRTPFQPDPPDTPTPQTTPAPIERTPNPNAVLTIWIDPALTSNLPANLELTQDQDQALLRIKVSNPVENESRLVSDMVFALAAPFPTLEDDISLRQWQDAWRGDGPELLMAESTYRLLEQVADQNPGSATILPEGELLDRAWEIGNAWAVLPFDRLEPRWKVLSIAGQSPIRKGFDPAKYPLAASFALTGESPLVDAVLALYGPQTSQPLVPPTNRDPGKLSTLAMTGVTALVRATAYTMEQQGIHYPARDILPWLQDADILHISNEVPFAKDCPFPSPVQSNVVFCSDPRYLDLLAHIGTDVVELTGDHFHDWGPEAMLFTLDLYAEKGWPVYGGGATFDLGRQPALLEHNGNRFAFIGCNGKGGGFAQAGPNNPGSVRCDFPWLRGEISRLEEQGYVVIATFQHFEYYTYGVPAAMANDFYEMARSGAAIVSGSQAHHPHGFSFKEGAFIHFGLGNTFFDQWGISLGTIQGMVDRHVIYEGRHVSTELLTMIFEDFARARPMSVEERNQLLRSVFSASEW